MRRLVAVQLLDQQHAQYRQADARHHAGQQAQAVERFQRTEDGRAQEHHIDGGHQQQEGFQAILQVAILAFQVTQQHQQEGGPGAVADYLQQRRQQRGAGDGVRIPGAGGAPQHRTSAGQRQRHAVDTPTPTGQQ